MNVLETTIATLTAEHNNLQEKLKQFEETTKTTRDAILAELTPLTKAIAALTGKSVTTSSAPSGTRKPMSEEGKENIRKALLARKERLATSATQTPAETAAVPSEGTEEASTTPETVEAATATEETTANDKKGGKRAAK